MNTNTETQGRIMPAEGQQYQNAGQALHRFTSSEGPDHLVELKYRSVENLAEGKLAKSLGIFSIGLGLAEVLMPAQMASLIGISDRHRQLLPALGVREIGHGLAIMRSSKPTAAVWSRVGGDLIDLAFLGSAASGKNNSKTRLAVAAGAVLGVALLDLVVARRLSGRDWNESDGNPKAPSTIGQPSGRVH